MIHQALKTAFVIPLLLIPITCSLGYADEKKESPSEFKLGELRLGIIGLDTSHAIVFTQELNNPEAKPDIAGCRVVAAYPKGSPDIESSVSRVPKYTEEIQEFGVKIVPSIAALLEEVDCVLLETNDGRPHLEQALQVIKAGKPLFVDKPLAGSLSDAVAIIAAARKANVPLFSSSTLRFGADTLAARNGSLGLVHNCVIYGPCSLEKTHPDLFWYGIHGVESLFTVMGTGCQKVVRRMNDGKIEVEGTWLDAEQGSHGRTGIFREDDDYSGLAKGAKGEAVVGSYGGYRPLIVEIVKFFRTGKPPVSAEETLEIYTFMEAADESKRQGGKAVRMQDVLEKAKQEADRRTSKLRPNAG